MKIAIFHNILWSRYKGVVFSALFEQQKKAKNELEVIQIAETEGDRAILSVVDLSYHKYPHELLFTGSYNATPIRARIVKLMRRAWKTDADVVVLPGFERLEFWAMLLILIVRRKPRLVFCDSTVRDKSQNFIKSFAKRIFFRRCDGFLCYGERSREYLMLHGAPDEKIYFRRQAAALAHDYSEATVVERRRSTAAAINVAPLFLYVGRLSKEKGLDTLIEAMTKLKHLVPSAKLRIIGAGPIKQQLQAQADAASLGSSVVFGGSMSTEQLALEYAAATALVLPSTSEPWGLVVNEALHYGCPCVVSDACGCVPELIVDGVTGFQFRSGDVNHLTESLIHSCRQFSNLEEVTKNCLERIRGYNSAHSAAQIIAACSSVIENEKRS